MQLLINQPEVLYTINIIQGTLYKNIPLLLIIGGIFFLLIFIFRILKIKIIFFKKNFNHIIIFTIILFWTPIYINHFYNNIYDLTENLDYAEYDISAKRIIRLCNIDHRQNLSGISCQLFSYVNYAKSVLPEKTEVKIISNPSLKTYLNYYLCPDFTVDNGANYLLFYFPNDYYYKDNILYKRYGNEDIKVGQYEAVGYMNYNRLILKKLEQ